jgi:hypothetical protein
MAFDRDAALAFKIHVVKHLILSVPFGDGSGKFKQSVGQGRFAVVDVGNNAEITNVFHGSKGKKKKSDASRHPPGNQQEHVKPGVSAQDGDASLKGAFL